MYGVWFPNERKVCFPTKVGEGWLSHKLISQNWACRETFVHLAQRERVSGETITLLTQSVS